MECAPLGRKVPAFIGPGVRLVNVIVGDALSSAHDRATRKKRYKRKRKRKKEKMRKNKMNDDV